MEIGISSRTRRFLRFLPSKVRSDAVDQLAVRPRVLAAHRSGARVTYFAADAAGFRLEGAKRDAPALMVTCLCRLIHKSHSPSPLINKEQV